MKKNLKLFEDNRALTDAVCALLTSTLEAGTEQGAPRAVMLPGGGTPQGIYRALAGTPPRPAVSSYVMLSDDRLEPDNTPASNYFHIRPMLEAAGFPEERVYRIDKALPLDEAARRYEAQLAEFLAEGGRIPLGLLGLGWDGHTAALFTRDHLASGENRLVIGLDRPDDMQGVTVTPALLSEVERLIFIVTGANKQHAVRTFFEDPNSITAGLASAGAARVEVWADREANPFDDETNEKVME